MDQRNVRNHSLMLVLLMLAALCLLWMTAMAQAAEDVYLPAEPGMVTDPRTGLTWMRCSLGQHWQAGACEGEAQEFSWDEARAVAQGFRYGGRDDWRLPDIDELRSLVLCSQGMEGEGRRARCRSGSTWPTIDTRVFPDTPDGYYWSVTPYQGDSKHAWILLLRDGGAYDGYDRDWDHHVRLVRGGG